MFKWGGSSNRAYVGFIVLGIAIDQLTKWVANVTLSFFDSVSVLPRILAFQLVHNYGAAYGIFANQRVFLIGVSSAVLVGCFLFRKKIATSPLSRWGLAFLMIGTAGNLIDRVVYGFVTDFVVIYIVPVFNLSDVAIDTGIAILIVDTFRHSHADRPSI